MKEIKDLRIEFVGGRLNGLKLNGVKELINSGKVTLIGIIRKGELTGRFKVYGYNLALCNDVLKYESIKSK